MSIKKNIEILKMSIVEYISIIVFSLGIGLLCLVQLYFHEVYKYSILQSSIILSSATFGQFVGSFISHYYVKLIKKLLSWLNFSSICSIRFSIFLLALSSGVLFVIFNLNPYYIGFIILSFILGVFLALFSPINMALLTADISLEQAATVTFLRRWAYNFGACIAFITMGYMLRNPHQLFTIIAIAFFMVAALEACKLFKLDNKSGEVKGNSLNSTFDHTPKFVWLWLFAVFLSAMVFFQTISTYPIYLQDYARIDTAHFSRLMMLSVILVLTIQFVTPILEKKVSISTISFIGVIFIGLGISMVLLNHEMAIISSVVIWSIGEILLLGVTPIYAKLFAGENKEKNLQYSSNYYSIFYLGKIIGPVVGSYFYSAGFQELTIISILGVSVFAGSCFLYLGVILKNSHLLKTNTR